MTSDPLKGMHHKYVGNSSQPGVKHPNGRHVCMIKGHAACVYFKVRLLIGDIHFFTLLATYSPWSPYCAPISNKQCGSAISSHTHVPFGIRSLSKCISTGAILSSTESLSELT